MLTNAICFSNLTFRFDHTSFNLRGNQAGSCTRSCNGTCMCDVWTKNCRCTFVCCTFKDVCFYRNVSSNSFWTPSRLMNCIFGQVQNNHWKYPHICYSFHNMQTYSKNVTNTVITVRHHISAAHNVVPTLSLPYLTSSSPVWPSTLWPHHDWRRTKIDWNNYAE